MPPSSDSSRYLTASSRSCEVSAIPEHPPPLVTCDMRRILPLQFPPMPAPTRQYRLLPECLPAAQERVRSRYLMPQLLVVVLFVLLSILLGAVHDRGHSSALRFVIPFGLFFTYAVFAAPR